MYSCIWAHASFQNDADENNRTCQFQLQSGYGNLSAVMWFQPAWEQESVSTNLISGSLFQLLTVANSSRGQNKFQESFVASVAYELWLDEYHVYLWLSS